MKEDNRSREYGKKMPSWLKAVIFALICTLLVIGMKKCVTGEANAAASSALRKENDVWNRKAIDSCIGLLKSGDLVVRTGRDVTSQIFRKFNATDQTFSHCGIVMIENGYPYVYHSIGGEDNPDAKLRRDSASFWFSAEHNLGLGVYRFDLAENQVLKLKKIVRQYYKERKKFDMQFDLRSDDRFYCAEFVYKSIKDASGDYKYIQPVTMFGHDFVPVDRLYTNEHARFICQVRYK